MRSKLRLAITVDPELPLPPEYYGGIERMVDMLVRGMMARGHSVTLFAHPDSRVPCRLEPYPARKSQSGYDLLRNMWCVSSYVLKEKPDLVHSFARLAYLLPILPLPIPKLMSYQRLISARSVFWGMQLARGTLHVAGCSQHILKAFGGNGQCHLVYNGVPLATYKFQMKVSDAAPLIFLGRIEEIKGPHLAVKVALSSGHNLIIAGNIPNEDKHKRYFKEKIEPYIDGKKIIYVGLVNDSKKNELLGQASALLMPVLWDEPFGIIMAEALACGTPVIGFSRGAVPEVVQQGVNGFVCQSVEEMAEAVKHLKEIDRSACRRIMEEKFSDQAVLDAYERLYLRLLY